MARRYTDLADRIVYVVSSGLIKAQGQTMTVYTNAAATTTANLAYYDPDDVDTPGTAVPGAVLAVDAYSLRQGFWDLDDHDILYIVSNSGGPVVPIFPDAQPQIVALDARVTALEPGGGSASVPATRQVIAGTGLTGGGTLAADRTLAVSYGTTAGTSAQGNDSRLSDARTPTSHAASHGSAGSDPISLDGSQITAGTVATARLSVGTTAGTVAAGDDSRITGAVPDSRTVTAGTGLTGGGDLTANRTLAVTYGTTAGTAAQGNDSRLSDARTPTAHAASHASAGSDPLSLAASQIASGTLAYARLPVGSTASTVAAGDDTRLNVPILPSDHGLLGWSVPIEFASFNSLLSVEAPAGTLRLSRIRRLAASSITSVNIYIITAGSSLSNCYAALYSSAGALIAQTADVSALWQSAGLKTMNLVGGPFAVSAGDYYIGLWYNGTTAPAVQRSGLGSASAQINVGQSSGSYSAASADSGLTTTAPSTVGSQTASALHWWVAVS